MADIKKYLDTTNRRVTIEYIMLDGINDSDECALELSRLLSGSYPTTSSIIPNKFEIQVECSCGRLFNMIDRASLLTNAEEKNIAVEASILIKEEDYTVLNQQCQAMQKNGSEYRDQNLI